MVQPPYAPPPSGPAPSWPQPPLGHPHQMARRGMSPTTLGAAVLGAALVGVGIYAAFFSGAGGPSGREILDTIDGALAPVACPVTGGADVQLLISATQLDVLGPDLPTELRGCLEIALAAAKFGPIDPTTLVQVKLPLVFDGQGKPSVGPSAAVQRLEASWKVGVLGDDIAGKRSRLGDLTEAGLPDLVECYAEAAIRRPGRLVTRSWHTQDEVMVRIRVAPDSSLQGMDIRRPGVTHLVDWSSAPEFSSCIQAAVASLNWPGHDGAVWNWVNTIFAMDEVSLVP